MRSIDGFNNGSAGSFGQGNSSAAGLNKLGTGIDIAKTAMSSEVTFQSSTGGTSYSTPIQAYDYGWDFKQFDVFVEKWIDPTNPTGDPEYRVRCVQGLTTFRNFPVDENGFITKPEFVRNRRIGMWNVYPTDSLVVDENGTDEYFISEGDYIKIEKNKNYKVFLYKISPTVDDYEASLCPQIAIIEENSPADQNVKSSFSGGGVMQTYIVSESNFFNNIVTADPFSGKIATFNAADLNTSINFNLDLLDIVRSQGQGPNHPDRYPLFMSMWLGEDFIPVFAKPEEMTQNDVLIGPLQNNLIGKGTGEVTSSWVEVFVDYKGYFKDKVIVGKDVGTDFGFTGNPIVSGLLNVNDFTLVTHNDAPIKEVLYFDDTEIDIISTNQVGVATATVEVPTDKPFGNVGFKYFDCARKELAHIKWIPDDPANPSGKGRFDVYQINNGPIVFQDEPLLLDVKKVQTHAEAKWDGNKDFYVSPEIVEIYYWGNSDSDYSKKTFKDNSVAIGDYLPTLPIRTSG